MKIKIGLFTFTLLVATLFAKAQTPDTDIDYLTPRQYEIADVTISGADNLDHKIILLLTGLTVGEQITIPGDKISNAIDKLWKQGLFEDIRVSIRKVEDRKVYLDIYLQERPRLSKFKFDGISKSDAEKIREKIKIMTGEVVTENMMTTANEKIRDFYEDKGYYNVQIEIKDELDTATLINDVILYFNIKKNEKVKIQKIVVNGNESLTDSDVRKALKDTKEYKWWKLWKSSKYIDNIFRGDLTKVIDKYNEKGFRNAKVVSDTMYLVSPNRAVVELNIYEGQKFYFGDIDWVGNTKYTNDQLDRSLRIKKGEPYNQKLLNERLGMGGAGQGNDVSSLYVNNGYLFFNANPVEVLVDNDSINLEIRIREGKQARINYITIVGNTTTNDRVILREIDRHTKPGDLYSQEGVMNSLRELANLSYFNQETITPNIKPNPENGTVDIEYSVEEVSTAQLELSGGWGGGMVVGSLGVSFTNFSARNFFNASAWKPLPAGDGQRLSLRGQTNGTYYYSVNASFTEPWLGGRKPNALTVSVFTSYQNNGFWSSNSANNYHLRISGVSVSLGSRLNWPDNFFTLIQGVAFQRYDAENYQTFFSESGYSMNLNYNITLGRNSVDRPIYPRSGSDVSVFLQLSPPYSLLNGKDYSGMTENEKYKWLEYYKVNFKAAWYFNVVQDLVFTTRFRVGFLGYYNGDIGYPPFDRYFLGGDGLSGWALDGREVVAMRGYGSSALSPVNAAGTATGASVFDKFTLELRYPITLNPQASIFALAFTEAGNSWLTLQEFNPFRPFVSAGLGVRIYMPMFGMFGFDWGYGFNSPPSGGKYGSQFHFSINQSID